MQDTCRFRLHARKCYDTKNSFYFKDGFSTILFYFYWMDSPQLVGH